MHSPGLSRLRHLALATSALVLGIGAIASAQSPIPSTPPSPPASPEMTANPNGWSPVRFVGGDPAVLVFTSDCGIPGVDSFHLVSVTGGWFAELAVTLTTYDASDQRYIGSQVGHVMAPNGADGPVDGEVNMAYDSTSGEWVLDGAWIEGVTLEVCSPLPSAGV